MPYDKIKNRERCRQYYLKNKEKIAARKKAYRLKPGNIEKEKERNKRYRENKKIEKLLTIELLQQENKYLKLQNKKLKKQIIDFEEKVSEVTV